MQFKKKTKLTLSYQHLLWMQRAVGIKKKSVWRRKTHSIAPRWFSWLKHNLKHPIPVLNSLLYFCVCICIIYPQSAYLLIKKKKKTIIINKMDSPVKTEPTPRKPVLIYTFAFKNSSLTMPKGYVQQMNGWLKERAKQLLKRSF